MKLYVKVWCPWCVAAREWLDTRGFGYQLIDVEEDRGTLQTYINGYSARWKANAEAAKKK